MKSLKLNYYAIYVVDNDGYDPNGDNLYYLSYTDNITWVSLYVTYVKSKISDGLRVEVQSFNTQSEVTKFIGPFIGGSEYSDDFELFLVANYTGTKFTIMNHNMEQQLFEMEAESIDLTVRQIMKIANKIFSLSRFIRFPMSAHIANLSSKVFSYMKLSELRGEYYETLLCYNEEGDTDKETLAILDMIREQTKLDPVMNIPYEPYHDGAFNYHDYIIETEYTWMGVIS